MKNKTIKSLLYAAAAIAVVGCAKSDLDGAMSESVSTINLYTAVGATRGADTSNSTIEGSQAVTLYAYSKEGTTYNFDYTHSGSVWSCDNENNTWATVGFPTSFYSAHDGSAQSLTVADGSATLAYTAAATGASSATKDLVYYGAEVTSMPVGGNITAYFQHALSKLNIISTVGTNSEKVYIASVKLMNVANSATLTINNNGTIDWNTPTSATTDYTYYTETPSENDDLRGDDNAIMMIPQTTSATAASALNSDTETYIEVIYYLTDSSGNPIVGYANAETDDYYGSTTETGPLYVKAAFPMQYTFAPSAQYNIELSFDSENSTGGYLLSDQYVDASGTEVTSDASLTIGDPAIANSSSTIGLVVTGIGSFDVVTPDVTPEGTEPPPAGAGTEDEPYLITSAAQFMMIEDYDSTEEVKYFELAQDITLDFAEYTPMELNGELIGGDEYYTITLTGSYNTERGADVGLFSTIGENGVVDNMILIYDNVTITGDSTDANIGGVAGVNNGEITNILMISGMSVSTTGTTYVGGLAGINNNLVNNCSNESTISVTSDTAYVGGIAGINNDTIVNNANQSTISVTSDTAYVGGIVGDCKYFINGNGYTGTIVVAASDNAYIGGMCGLVSVEYVAIYYEYSEGTIRTTSTPSNDYYVADIVGYVTATGVYTWSSGVDGGSCTYDVVGTPTTSTTCNYAADVAPEDDTVIEDVVAL